METQVIVRIDSKIKKDFMVLHAWREKLQVKKSEK